LFLIDSGKPEQIGVLPERKSSVAVPWHFIVAVKESDGIVLQQRDQFFPVLHEQLFVDGRIFHSTFFSFFKDRKSSTNTNLYESTNLRMVFLP
jgi:hypothetical protein